MSFGSFSRKFGLKAKIVTVIVCVIILTTVIGSSFFYAQTRDIIFDNLQKRGQAICESLSYRARYGILTEDSFGLSELIIGLMWTEDLAYVVIENVKGKVLASESIIEIPQETEIIKHQQRTLGRCKVILLEDSSGNLIYDLSAPVIITKTSLAEIGGIEPDFENTQNTVTVGGKVRIGLSLNNVLNSLHDVVEGIIILNLAMIAVAIVFSLVFARLITRPIRNMAAAAAKVGSGDLSQTVEVKTNDEIGQFARQFNIMTTALKSHEEKLKTINKELEDFAYITSHDLKAPLRGIKTLAEWITTDYAEKLDDDGKEQLNLLLSRVDRMHNLIDGILQYSRAGRTEQGHQRLELEKLLPGIIDTLSPPDNIKISIENKLPVVQGEETRIIQIFQNLLSNAIKYMDKDQGYIRISCVQNGSFWKFSITDNGPGIEEKHFDKIFKIFQTLVPRDEYESTGVGLSVVKKIVKLYGGTIWVESELGKGATFFFTFPKESEIAI